MAQGLRFVCTGDITQIDLPHSTRSGLIEALNILQNVPGIGFVHLGKKDIVRHKLVTRIVEAYEKKDKEKEKQERQEKQEKQ